MHKLGLGIAALLIGTAASASTIVATRNFDAPNFTLAGVTAVTVGGGGAVVGTQSITGFGANMFRNSTTGLWEITLSNLPAHVSVTIDVDLAFLDSWDSTDGVSGVTPDILTWFVDGVAKASLTAAIQSGSINDFAGGTVLQTGSDIWSAGGPSYNDRTVDMSTSTLKTFAHSSSTLTFGLQVGGAGWQGGADESWGFDNLVISVNPVPEPATWALLIAGFGLVGVSLRRRRALVACSH